LGQEKAKGLGKAKIFEFGTEAFCDARREEGWPSVSEFD
jgi:hypothetical protein